MMVSLRRRLVIMAMPKCASSALEQALSSQMDVVIQGIPSAKHTPFRKYQRYLKKYFETFTDGPLETVCLFREPSSWLNSWWRYRARAKMPNGKRSTRGMTFDAFVNRYMEDTGPPADIGRQSRFISNADGVPSVDRLFRYEDLEGFQNYVSDRLEIAFTLERTNVSPEAHQDEVLQPDTKRRLQECLALDFEIHDGLERKP